MRTPLKLGAFAAGLAAVFVASVGFGKLAGPAAARSASGLGLRISRGGVPVKDLEPYLGARGHLVALRQGDLAYLHVHPDEMPEGGGAGPRIGFTAEVPTQGAYRLYLDFQHGGAVHTAEFTAVAEH
jgi:hypothetical protein